MNIKNKIFLLLFFVMIVVVFYMVFRPKSWQELLKNTDYIYLDIIARENPTRFSTDESNDIISVLQRPLTKIVYSYNFFPMYILSFSSIKMEIKLEENNTIIKINEKYFQSEKYLFYKIKELLNDEYDSDEFYNRIQYYKDAPTKEESANKLLSSIYTSDIKVSSISTYPHISESLGGIYYERDGSRYFAVAIIDKNRVYFIAEKEDGVGDITNQEFALLIYNNSVLGSHDH